MSKDEDRARHSKRLHDRDVKIKKQVRIAQMHGIPNQNELLKQPHRLAKHHAMDCGNPDCHLCGNPRKIYGEKTIQERRLEQVDIETSLQED